MNLIALFRQNPVVIEAIQFADDADTISNIHGFMGSDTTVVDYAAPDAPVVKIETLEGTMSAQVGDWIIKGIKGEFYPCKPEIFEATYSRYSEPVGEEPAAIPSTLPTDGLTFGQALVALDHGDKLDRKGWEADKHVRMETINTQGSGSTPHVFIASPDGLLISWEPSQADLLAKDWCIIEQ